MFEKFHLTPLIPLTYSDSGEVVPGDRLVSTYNADNKKAL